MKKRYVLFALKPKFNAVEVGLGVAATEYTLHKVTDTSTRVGCETALIGQSPGEFVILEVIKNKP